ncbi:hypothetical protein E2C01_039410 [Portunus trituberculatus]|uniref:Uncharacterized protein n=1 Tax=Portunus trituberculatus TaxID=210409 RepID=A0A5B7FMY8_PORTR|nr:hypothetical protein [Portunus trituberculatus]
MLGKRIGGGGDKEYARFHCSPSEGDPGPVIEGLSRLRWECQEGVSGHAHHATTKGNKLSKLHTIIAPLMMRKRAGEATRHVMTRKRK